MNNTEVFLNSVIELGKKHKYQCSIQKYGTSDIDCVRLEKNWYILYVYKVDARNVIVVRGHIYYICSDMQSLELLLNKVNSILFGHIQIMMRSYTGGEIIISTLGKELHYGNLGWIATSNVIGYYKDIRYDEILLYVIISWLLKLKIEATISIVKQSIYVYGRRRFINYYRFKGLDKDRLKCLISDVQDDLFEHLIMHDGN